MEEAMLGGLSAQAFLRRHWQKRPLLVRGALPGFRGVIGKSALFRLATRGDIESRLVERRRGRWKVTHGPLGYSLLQKAGLRDWTVLINGVNCFSDAAERLLRRFSFIPQARLDDVMVSYAAPGGGVGPHFDSYDVFLIQGAGRRIWRLARKKSFACEAQAPLRLIRDFVPDEEYLLEPGDLLYLPPGWGHDGVALEACFTYSVGFRAPSASELAAGFLDYLHERGLPVAAYRDPDLRVARHPARIGDEMAAFARRQLARIRWRPSDVDDFLGRYLSTPKPNVVFARNARSPRAGIAGSIVRLHAKTQMLYRGARFYLNGEPVPARRAQRAALSALADGRRAPGRLLARAGLEPLVLQWHRAGFLDVDPRT
jgi:50S ribosomal protein L16 3-hydroxylase